MPRDSTTKKQLPAYLPRADRRRLFRRLTVKKRLVLFWIALLTAVALFTSADAKTVSEQFKKKGYRIAYVLNGTSTEIFKMAFDAAVREGAIYGMKVDVFTADGDDVRFQDIVNQCAQRGYDGMIISHGKPQYSYDLVKAVAAKGIKVVTFDTVIKDSAGNGIPGVTRCSRATRRWLA